MTLPHLVGGEMIGLVANPHAGPFAPPLKKPVATSEASQNIEPNFLYDQQIRDAWELEQAGYPRLAELALAEGGIKIDFAGDGK